MDNKLKVETNIFKFNNSSLFSDLQEIKNTSKKQFWQMNQSSLDQLSKLIMKSKPINLNNTIETIQSRFDLESIIYNVQPLIISGNNKIDELKQFLDIIDTFEKEQTFLNSKTT